MFDESKAEQIIGAIANGESAKTACDSLGHPRSSFYAMLAKEPEGSSLLDKYTRAMEIRADVKADEIDEIADDVRYGRIQPDAARVAIDARKWTAAKLRPKKYGDRIAVDADMRLQVTIEDPTARVTATLVTPPALPKP